MAAPVVPNFADTRLTFVTDPIDGKRAYQSINASSETGQPITNVAFKEHAVKIENIRGREADVSLDRTGFQFFREPTKFQDYSDDTAIEREYYPESIELMKRLTGASRVVLFDHTIRRRRPTEFDDAPNKRQPVSQAHVDQTNSSAVSRVHRHLPPEDAPALLKGRFQVVNMWRPINHIALDWPLALCDFRTVDVEKDLLAIALVYPDREGETYGVKYNENQRWVYLRGMDPDEVALIKCFDSQQDGSVALLTPHTAFSDPTTPADAPLRESIELRFLVFYD
ncbi:unnamed protein product [Mycena citricolor]|uniref:7alpha-cephem-methoxylase P8 chain related protein n=2 Tax=Mycena citricolor TaxID=2018698 RepID=A0AAD2JUC3_9AGAR|nr:unnamed protein product [Mycena citricolor]